MHNVIADTLLFHAKHKLVNNWVFLNVKPSSQT